MVYLNCRKGVTMTEIAKEILEKDLPAIFTARNLEVLMPDSRARSSQMKRALLEGEIIRIWEDIYILGKPLRKKVINEHLLANIIEPESYVSFETALWDARWIPDFPFEIASVTLEKDLMIRAGFVRFSYTKIRQKDLFCGTEMIECTGYSFREAKPLKALADYVYNIGYEWTTTHPLTRSLRIDIENLETLTPEDFDELQGNYEVPIVENFLEGIRRELNV
jgi:hypothetical protein